MEKPQVTIARSGHAWVPDRYLPRFVVSIGSDADAQLFPFGWGYQDGMWRHGTLTAPHGPLSTYRYDLLRDEIALRFGEFLWRYVGTQAELELTDP